MTWRAMSVSPSLAAMRDSFVRERGALKEETAHVQQSADQELAYVRVCTRTYCPPRHRHAFYTLFS
jgi:hypothetical protein